MKPARKRLGAIWVVAILLIAGAGGGAYWYFTTKEPVNSIEDSPTPLAVDERENDFGNWTGSFEYDSNGDKVDDAIAASSSERTGVFVAYSRRPSEQDLQALSSAGFSLTYQPHSLDGFYGTIPADRIQAAAALAGVVQVAKDEELDSSAMPAVSSIRANAEGLPDAASLGATGKGVVIAVLDTGIDERHTCFKKLNGENKVIGGADLVSNPPRKNPSTNPDPSTDHGTNTACVAAGAWPDEFDSVATEAMIVDVKVLGDGVGSAATLVAGIDWVTSNSDHDWGVPGFRGIQVMSISINSVRRQSNGCSWFDGPSCAVDDAAQAGVIPVVSMGQSQDPSSNDYGIARWVSSPAAADSAIVVAGVDHKRDADRGNDVRYDSGHIGPRKDGAKKPTIVAPAVNVVTASPGGGSTATLKTGTSLAAPMVAGVVALLLETDPSLSRADIFEILTSTAEAANLGDCEYADGWSTGCGYGYIDAFAAVKAAQDLKPNQPPNVDFSFTPTNPEAGQEVRLTDHSYDPDGQVVSWFWTFEGGAISSQRNPVYAFQGNGTFFVWLTVTDDRGEERTTSRPIVVGSTQQQPSNSDPSQNKAPVASFSFSPQNPQVAQNVQFTDLSHDEDGHISSWHWAFGDGSSSTGASPTHAYSHVGEYLVELVVTDDSESNSSSFARVLRVMAHEAPGAGPNPVFQAEPGVGYVGQAIKFVDQSTDADGWIPERYWDFGDGTTLNNSWVWRDVNVTHVYLEQGTFEVTLAIADDKGNTASMVVPFTVIRATCQSDEFLPPGSEIIVREDFESAELGAEPQNWEKHYNYPQVSEITDWHSCSGNKSYKKQGPRWPTVSRLAFESEAHRIGYSVAIMTDGVGRLDGGVGFYNETLETPSCEHDGRVSPSCKGKFWASADLSGGTIRADRSDIIGSYGGYAWQRLAVILDREIGRYDVWIDGTKVAENLIAEWHYGSSGTANSFAFMAESYDYTIAYIDDLVLFELP